MSTSQWWWVRHAPVPDGGRIYGQRDLDCDCSDGGIFTALARELPREAVWVTSQLKRATQTAGSLTYTTLLSLVPLLTVALGITTAFPVFNQWIGSLQLFILENVLPDTPAVDTIVNQINSFTENVGRLTAIGSVRARYWNEALEIFQGHPLLGVGAEGYETAHLRYRTAVVNVSQAHGFVAVGEGRCRILLVSSAPEPNSGVVKTPAMRAANAADPTEASAAPAPRRLVRRA